MFWSCEQSIGIAPDGIVDFDIDPGVIDTFSIFTYTQIEDSIVTSAPSYLLTGSSTFDYSGRVNATSYLNLRPGGDLELVESGEVYDSLYLFLFFNDLLTPKNEEKEYTVHLIEPVNIEDLEVSYYNFDELAYDEMPIGRFTYHPYYEKGDSIAIKIDSGLGEELFSWAHEGIVGSTNTEFVNRFTGIAIKPADGNDDQIISLLNNVTTSTNLSAQKVNRLRMYYHEDGDYVETKKFDFINTFYTASFNSIDVNLQGSYLSDLIMEEEVASEDTYNLSFLQSGIGVYSRLTFPYLYKINELGKEYFINSAELIIEPTTDSYSYYNPLPDSLAIFLINNLNESGEFGYNSSDIESYLQYAKLEYDYELGGSAQYRFNITDLVYLQLEDNGFREYSVLLTPTFSSALTCFDQVYVPNTAHSSAGVKLKIYVTKILNIDD